MYDLVYRLKDIEADPAGLPVDVALDAAALRGLLGDDLSPGDDSAAAIRARLLKQGENVLCHGALSGHLTLPCQRCLEPARVPVDQPLHLTFVPKSTPISPFTGEPEGAHRHHGAAQQIEDPFDPDDLDYGHHDRETVDLGSLVREYLVLSVPMTILCREGCLGLCPACGIDRNRSRCSCAEGQAPEKKASPFAALKNFDLNRS